MEDWNVRCRRLLQECRGTGLLPEGVSSEELVQRLSRDPAASEGSDDLWVLALVSPRLRPEPDTECIYEDSSYADFARPFAELAEDVLGPVEIESRYDGHAEKAFITLRARGREHSLELEQSTDYADTHGVLEGLNHLVGDAPRLFYAIDHGDGFVGFLTEAEVGFLRKKGYAIRKPNKPEVEPEEEPEAPAPLTPAPARVPIAPAKTESAPEPSRRLILLGIFGTLGGLWLLKVYAKVARGPKPPKDAGPQGVSLAQGQMFTGREFFSEAGRKILVVRSYKGDLRAAFTPYDYRKGGNEEALAEERLKKQAVQIPSGSTRQIEIRAEQGTVLWGIWNDGPEAASFDCKTLSE